MADLPHRLTHEKDFAKRIAAILDEHRAEWEQGRTVETERDLDEGLLALLLLLFGLGATSAAGELGIGLVIEGGASLWAGTNTPVMTRRIMLGISRRLQRARVADLQTNPGLNTIFNQTVESIILPKTWNNFAATEVTRAYTAGGEYTAAIYNIGRIIPQRAGALFTMPTVAPLPGAGELVPPSATMELPEPATAIWSTEKDSRVCPICKPLDSEPREVWADEFPLGPPAHDMCRCFLSYSTESLEHVISEGDCGANAPGGGGFQKGNTCGKDGRSETRRGVKIDYRDDGTVFIDGEHAGRLRDDGKVALAMGGEADIDDMVAYVADTKDAERGQLPKQRPTTQTKDFKDWFDGSQVVDLDGNPLIVYHGMGGELQGATFDPLRSDNVHSQALGKPTYFFTDNIAVASTYAAYKQAPSTLPVYLAIKNPLVVNANGKDWTEALSDIQDSILPEHDGAIVRNVLDSTDAMPIDAGTYAPFGTVYIAFDREQIKSATGNRGTYSRKSKRIDEQAEADEYWFHRNQQEDARELEHCGANAPGGGGFQAGNTCGKDGGGEQPKQTDSAAFKAWFGDSKVVDENGKPLVVYHGTGEAFTSFDAETGKDLGGFGGGGVFFSESPEVASSYANQQSLAMKQLIKSANDIETELASLSDKLSEKASEMPPFPSSESGQVRWMNDALDRGFITRTEYDAWDSLSSKLYDANELLDKANWSPNYDTTPNIVPAYLRIERPLVVDANGMNWDLVVPHHMTTVDRSKHDGIVFKNIRDSGDGSEIIATNYVVFSPTQIKSATGNKGTWDGTNPDIREQHGA